MDNRYYDDHDFDDEEIHEDEPNYSEVLSESSGDYNIMQDDTSYNQAYDMEKGIPSKKEVNQFNRHNHQNELNNQHYSPSNSMKKPNSPASRMNQQPRPGSPENHNRPNLGVPTKKNSNDNISNGSSNVNKTNKDVGKNNLQKTLSNRVRNAWNNVKNKKKKDNKENNSDSSSENQSENEKENSEAKEFTTDDLAIMRRKKLKIKLILYGLIAFLIIIIFGTIIMAIFGVNISSIAPAINESTYETDKFEPTYEKGTDKYDKEIAYYKKLKEAKAKYLEETGEEIKTNYVHSILLYIYYLVSDDEIVSEDEDATFEIDYSKMTDMVDTIVELMKPKDSSKNIDYEKKGEFYNNLKESVEFKKYYKEVLNNMNIEELLDDIFDFAFELGEIEDYEDDTVLSNETGVGVQQTSSDGKTTVKNLSMNEYLSGSIYANNSINNPEKVKAYTIVYSTNLVAKNKKLTVNSANASADTMYCSVKEGCSYDANGNLVDGSGERSNKNTIYYNGSYYYKQPLSNSEIDTLNKNINSVYGNVLVNSDGTYPEVDVNTINGLGDSEYKDILKSGYGDYKLKNVGEDSYILDGSYGTKKVLTDAIFYDQNDYKEYQFCGIKSQSIKSSGCGTTAMAIVTSTYENNKKYDPVMMMKTAHSGGYCGKGISGTSPSFFKKEANTMKYKYLRASKRSKSDLNLVLKHLSQGHLVITHMKSGHFTGGGHYMVLGGVDPDTKKVYVYDPNNASNKKNRKTGNGWYSYNDIIVKESFNYFYIIWKG